VSTKIKGELEIDSERGVIYFHAMQGQFKGVTLMRICRLPAPIPVDKQLDITFDYGCDWTARQDHQRLRVEE
jgi:hypothetical protein